MDENLSEPAINPGAIHFESTTGTKAGYLSGWPCPGQPWQQMDGSRVALHQHLAEAGRGAKITVDLERWMGVEEVRIHPATAISIDGFRSPDHVEQTAEHCVRVIAVPQPGPEIDFPGAAPASAFVAAGLQGNAGGFGQFRGGCPGDLATGIQGEQM